METKEKNYYDILEVPLNSSIDEIQNAYHQAKNAYSQDSVALYSLINSDDCSKMLELIDEAYLVVNDPGKRAQYNKAKGLSPEETDPTLANRNKKRKSSSNLPFPEKPFKEDRGSVSVSKIVAQKKFSLEYVKDPKFEQEIENCTEFSGTLLKKIREYRNVDIIRMADMTKVSKTYLQNIEKEDIRNLPALVYVRGFVYQYAKCLKLNPELVATSYLYRLKRLKEEQ